MKAVFFNSKSRNIHLILTILGTSGIVGVFLPFYWSYSPFNAIFDLVAWQLASPSLLSFFIFMASVRIIFSGSLKKAEKIIAYNLGALSSCITFSLIPILVIGQMAFSELFAIIVGIIIILFGVFLVIKNLKKKVKNTFNPLIAIQIPYIANCVMCIILFYWNGEISFLSHFEIGAYFCLTATIVYIIQIALFFTHKGKTEVITS